MMDQLARENRIVLQALQASHGLISPDMLAIAVQVMSDSVVLHFAVKRKTGEIKEDIDDILFELDALLGGCIVLKAEIFKGIPDRGWVGRRYRLLYLAKNAALR